MISTDAIFNGGATLDFTTFTFERIPIISLPALIASARRISNRTEEKNLSARPPGVVSGLPNIMPTFSLIWLIKIATTLDFEITPDIYALLVTSYVLVSQHGWLTYLQQFLVLVLRRQPSQSQSCRSSHFLSMLQQCLTLVHQYLVVIKLNYQYQCLSFLHNLDLKHVQHL